MATSRIERQQLVEHANEHEWQIEILWRRTAPSEWVALLRSRETGRQCEARSLQELQAALERLGATVASQEPARVCLLGGLRLFLGETEVPLLEWWSRMRKLLAYLVVHRGRPVSRDILLEEFWPGGDPQRAGHCLHTTISLLRRLLRSVPGVPAAAERLIIARDGGYLFDSDGRCEVDIHRFDHHFQEGMRFKKAGHLDEAAAHWAEADRLYAGDLLPEFPYEDWCASPRERLRSQCLELLLNLAMYHRQARRPREALRTAERIFAIDGCDERAHRMVMRCYVQMGRPVEALRQFERCCQVLERELRVRPSRLTRDLHELIRRKETEMFDVNSSGEDSSDHVHAPVSGGARAVSPPTAHTDGAAGG